MVHSEEQKLSFEVYTITYFHLQKQVPKEVKIHLIQNEEECERILSSFITKISHSK